MKKSFISFFAALPFLCLSFHSMAKLDSVGPRDTMHGFPAWYKDSKGTKLSLCVNPADKYCFPLVDVDPTLPVSFPGNFPGEAYWWRVEAQADVKGGGHVSLECALKAAFALEEPEDGQRISYSRIRIRGNSVPKGTFRITHPFGQKTFTVTSITKRNINFTSDIGSGAKKFERALKGDIGPFLTWDLSIAPKPPAGYIGDPSVPHEITGSPKKNNLLQIERKSGSKWVKVGKTVLFKVAGKLALKKRNSFVEKL